MNKTFAFLFHPVELSWVRNLWPATRILPDFILESTIKLIPPFKISHIKKIRSTQGQEIDGCFIFCPLLPKQMVRLEEKFVLDRIISAGRIAERLGAKILGLGGYTSIVGDKGYTIAKNLKIPVTSGNTLTAWAVFEAIYRISRIKKMDLRKSTLAVIGATGSIGNLCARKLSEYTPRIIITARNRDKLEQLKETLLHINSLYADPNRSLKIIIEEDAHEAVKDADIVITATSFPESLLDITELKKGSIVCDVSIPKNIAGKPRQQNKDITIIEGGLIKLPYPVNFGLHTGLHSNIIYGCVAETMLLTFEERFTSYSLGDNINLDKLEEIADIGVQHGFEVWVP